MARPRSIPLIVVFAAVSVLGWVQPRLDRAAAEDTKPPAKPPAKPVSHGPTYKNASLGLTAQTPAGWRLVASKGSAPTSWKLLATFNDSATDAQVTLSVRPRTATTVDDLLRMVSASWDKSRGKLSRDSTRKVMASALEPIAKVVVRGSFKRASKTEKPGPDGVEPPPKPPVTYLVQASYMLGPGYEYLLYAQGQKTHWSRLRGPIREIEASIKLAGNEPTGPKGAGSFRDEKNGFACTFPVDFTVVRPQRVNHVVKFKGVGAADPELSVYAFSYGQGADKDAERLVTFYEEDKGGSASYKTTEIAGQEGVLVRAEATLNGTSEVVLIGILKRGDTCFRLKASMPAKSEAAGTSVFHKFMDGFRLLAAPK